MYCATSYMSDTYDMEMAYLDRRVLGSNNLDRITTAITEVEATAVVADLAHQIHDNEDLQINKRHNRFRDQ